MELHSITYNDKPFEFVVARSKKRRRTIAIHVSKTKGIELKVPHRTSHERIMEIIHQRLEWIQQKLASLPATQTESKPWYERENLFYLGQSYTLALETFPFAKKRAECQLRDSKIVVTLAQGLSIEENKKFTHKTLEAWYRQKAEELLLERTRYFAEILKVAPKKIIIKTQRSRWGSCDRHNNIRYNWKIIMTHPELVDYLVVHELAHIRVKNHSKKFWDVVASVLPDHQLRRKRLRDFAQEITMD